MWPVRVEESALVVEGAPKGRTRLGAVDVGPEVRVLREQGRSTEPAQYVGHHQVAGAEGPVEPVSVAEPA